MNNLKAIGGIAFFLILVFVAGRYFKKRSDNSEYREWQDQIEKAAKRNPGYISSDEIQVGRAHTLITAFQHKVAGLFPATDEEKVFAVFKGFQSVPDFVRFNTIFRWNGKNLTDSMNEELQDNELRYVNKLLIDSIGIELLET